MQQYLLKWLNRCYGIKVPSAIATLKLLLQTSANIRIRSSDGMFGLENNLLIVYDRSKLKAEMKDPITSWERSLKHCKCFVLSTTHAYKDKWWCIGGSKDYFQPMEDVQYNQGNNNQGNNNQGGNNQSQDNKQNEEHSGIEMVKIELDNSETCAKNDSNELHELFATLTSGTQFDNSLLHFAAGIKYIKSAIDLPDPDIPDEWYEDKKIAKREIIESIEEIFSILPQKRTKN